MAAPLAVGSLARVVGENPEGISGPHYIVSGSIVQILDQGDADFDTEGMPLLYGCKMVLGAFSPDVYADYGDFLKGRSAVSHPWEVAAVCLEPVEQVPQ